MTETKLSFTSNLCQYPLQLFPALHCPPQHNNSTGLRQTGSELGISWYWGMGRMRMSHFYPQIRPLLPAPFHPTTGRGIYLPLAFWSSLWYNNTAAVPFIHQFNRTTTYSAIRIDPQSTFAVHYFYHHWIILLKQFANRINLPAKGILIKCNSNNEASP